MIIDDCTNESFPFSISINLQDETDISMNAPPYVACYGDVVEVTPVLNGGSGDYSYVWPDNSTGTSFDYVFELGQGETQDVDLTIVDDCTNESFPFSIPINNLILILIRKWK